MCVCLFIVFVLGGAVWKPTGCGQEIVQCNNMLSCMWLCVFTCCEKLCWGCWNWDEPESFSSAAMLYVYSCHPALPQGLAAKNSMFDHPHGQSVWITMIWMVSCMHMEEGMDCYLLFTIGGNSSFRRSMFPTNPALCDCHSPWPLWSKI